jgi:hypothetical protein
MSIMNSFLRVQVTCPLKLSAPISITGTKCTLIAGLPLAGKSALEKTRNPWMLYRRDLPQDTNVDGRTGTDGFDDLLLMAVGLREPVDHPVLCGGLMHSSNPRILSIMREEVANPPAATSYLIP